jgi:Flp pilus assembly protein TadG
MPGFFVSHKRPPHKPSRHYTPSLPRARLRITARSDGNLLTFPLAILNAGHNPRMRHSLKNHRMDRRRHGVAIIYVFTVLLVLLAFCSFAVDLARVQTAKTEIRRAADAAARAGAAYLPQGSGSVTSAAIAMAANDKVDSQRLVLQSTDVSVGIWNKRTQTFSASGSADNITTFNAVQVVAQRTAARRNAIPLLFGSILGADTCNVTATSVAALVSISQPQQLYVSAHGNPWLAGEPAGTLGSEPDHGYSDKTHPFKYDVANPTAVASADASAANGGSYSAPTDPTKVESTDYTSNEPYSSPSEFVLNVAPGSVVQISIPENSENVATNHGYLTGDTPDYYATGSSNGSYAYYSDDAANPSLPQGTNTTEGSEHGISNIIAPINSVIGVFLDKTGSTDGADSESAPTGTDYSVESNQDYTSAEPQLNQSFYVGDGQNSSGIQQTIIVPNNAYALFLGTMDGHEWSNNVGGYHATITQFSIELVK